MLFITSFHPDGQGFIGAGESVCGRTLRALLALGKEVHVLCLAPGNQSANPDLASQCASYLECRHGMFQSVLAVLYGWRSGSLLVPWLFTRVSPRNLGVARAVYAAHNIDAVWLDFPSSLGFARCFASSRVEYFAHDVVFQRISRRPLLGFLQAAVRRVELRLLAHVDRCQTLSHKDAVLLREAGYRGELVVAPAAGLKVGSVREGMSIETVLRDFPGHANLVFFGNMHRPENHGSILHFLRVAYLHIRRRHPNVQFWILGLAPRWTLRLHARFIPGVHVVGAVDDPLPAFQAATLCVVPLLTGAGVKLKVVQMLEAGATVVTTPVGAEGIDASPRLRVVAMAEFAQEVCRLLEKRPKC